MKIVRAVGSALAALALAGAAVAQDQDPRGPRSGGGPAGGPSGGPGGGGPGGPPPIERMLERLGLSEDQKAAVHAVHEKHVGTIRPLADAARQAHEAFQKALDTQPADATKIGELAISMNAAQKKFDAARKAEMDEIKAILTPEQRERLEQALQRGPGGPAGRGPGGPGGPGGPSGSRPDGPPGER